MNAGHPAPGSPVGSAVARWKFDEGTVDTCIGETNDFCDSSENGNDLAFSGTSAQISFTNSGKFAKAFNGNGAVWASRADDSDFDVGASDDYSISLWFRSDSATNPSSTEYIFNKANATTAGYAIYANTSGQICFGIDDDATWNPDVFSCSPNDIYDNLWHHIVAVRNTSSDQLQLYVDAKLADSDSDTTSATLANSLSLYLADRDGTDNGDEFNGDLDETSVFRLALTPDQVRVLHNQGATSLLGATSTDSSGNPSWSSSNEYCPPGQGSVCTPPIAEWKLDENTGQWANDTSTNNANGCFEAASCSPASPNSRDPLWVPGKVGSALMFDDTDDVVLVPDRDSIDIGTSNFSIEVWMYLNNYNSSNYDVILNKGSATGTCSDSSQNGYSMVIYRGIGDEFSTFLCVYPNYWEMYTSSQAIPAGGWHQVVATVDRATPANSRTYLDGVLLPVSYGGTMPTASLANTSDLLLGTTYGTGSSNRFNGKLDQIRIYDYVRTPEQVAWTYNKGAPLIWYKFDECSGSTANNSAPTATGADAGNDATITIGASGSNTSTGTCNSGTSTEAWNNGTSGKTNSSIDFDGTDDYAVSPNSAIMAGNSLTYKNLSWGGWFNPGTSPTSDTLITKNNEFRLTTNSSGNPQCQIYSGGAWQTAVTASSALSTNSWSHIMCTYDGANIRLYINGILAASGSQTASITSTNTTALSIGRDPAGSGYFDGKVDEVKVFNYNLTIQQIRNLFNEGAIRFGY